MWVNDLGLVSIELSLLPHLQNDGALQAQPPNFRAQRVSVFPIRSVLIRESEVTPAVAAFGATHFTFFFASQLRGQISVAHVRVLLDFGRHLGFGDPSS